MNKFRKTVADKTEYVWNGIGQSYVDRTAVNEIGLIRRPINQVYQRSNN